MNKRLLLFSVFAVLVIGGALTAYFVFHKAPVSYKVGDTFTIKLDGPYWDDLSYSPDNILEQVNRDPATCPPEFGCNNVTFTVKAISKGRVLITDSRPQCGEAMACQGNDGQFSEEVTVR